MVVFQLRRRVTDDFGFHVRSFLSIRHEKIQTLVNGELKHGLLWPEPLVVLNPALVPGERLEELAERGVLDPRWPHIFANREAEGPFGAPEGSR